MKESFYRIVVKPKTANFKFCFAFFFIFNLFSQSFTQSSNFSYTFYNKSSGLNLSDEIADVKFDSHGYLWIITFSEIIKYDGSSFKAINTTHVSHSSFINFFESEGGLIRCVYDKEGSVFFINDDSLIEFEGNAIISAENLNNKLFDIFYENGILHASIPGYGYLKLKGRNKIEEPYFDKFKQNGISCVLLENGRPFIVGGLFNKKSNERIFRIFDKDFNEIAKLPIAKYSAHFNSSIVKLSSSNYLISTGKGHLLEFSKDGKIINHQFNHPIIKLFVDSKKNIWISSTNGVYLVKSDEEISSHEKVNSIEKGFIISGEDNSGGIWGYSEKSGIIHISQPWLKQITLNAFEDVTSIDLFDNNLYVSNINSIVRIDYSKSKSLENVLDNSKSEIHNINYHPNDSTLWVSQRMGLGYVKGKKLVNIPLDTIFRKNSGRIIRTGNNITKTKSNRLYGAYRNRFFKFNKDSFYSISKPFPNFLTQLYEIGDTLLISSEENLYLLSENKINSLKNRYDLQLSDLLSCVVFNDTIWLSTRKNVFKLKALAAKGFGNNGFSLQNTQIIKQDSTSLWLFSDHGSINYKRIGNKFEIFKYQKLPDLAIKKIVNNDKQVCFVTKKGLVYTFKFEELEQYPIISPQLFFTRARFGNLDFTYLVDSAIELSYLNNSLHLKYTTINYSNDKTVFRYKIAQLNNQWTITEDPALNIYNIPNGSYELEIQSRIGLQPWGKSRVVKFKILPPFYKTWWFITAAFILFISTLYLLLRYKMVATTNKKNLIISRLKAEQKALLARMDPHFIFNIISSLQYLIIKKKNDDASAFLNRFAIIMRNNLKQTESDKISLEDEIQFLKEYINLEKMRFENHFNFLIEIDDSIDQKTMIPTFLIQPLVENSIKHGFEQFSKNISIKVNFKLIDGFLIVEVEDDGLGYNKSIQRKANIGHFRKDSYGLSTIKERIELYNGNIKGESFELIDLKTTDAKKSGTLVRVRIKLN